MEGRNIYSLKTHTNLYQKFRQTETGDSEINGLVNISLDELLVPFVFSLVLAFLGKIALAEGRSRHC